MECPPATQDVAINTKNRNATIKNYEYGPLNVDEPGDYWEKIAKRWKTTVKAAKKSKCGNCVAFDRSPRMKACMPGETSDGEGVLGYCWMHHFKCHSARTCDTWAKGGPITTNSISEGWQERAFAKPKASKVATDATKPKAKASETEVFNASMYKCPECSFLGYQEEFLEPMEKNPYHNAETNATLKEQFLEVAYNEILENVPHEVAWESGGFYHQYETMNELEDGISSGEITPQMMRDCIKELDDKATETFEANAKTGNKVYIITRRCEDYSAYRELDVAVFGSKTEAKKKFNMLFKRIKNDDDEMRDMTIAEAKGYMYWGEYWGIESFGDQDLIYELRECIVGEQGDFWFDAENFDADYTKGYTDTTEKIQYEDKYGRPKESIVQGLSGYAGNCPSCSKRINFPIDNSGLYCYDCQVYLRPSKGKGMNQTLEYDAETEKPFWENITMSSKKKKEMSPLYQGLIASGLVIVALRIMDKVKK